MTFAIAALIDVALVFGLLSANDNRKRRWHA